MFRFAATLRISIGMACLAVSVLLAAYTLGLLPDEHSAIVEGRRRFCETLAINTSLLAQTGNAAAVEAALQASVKRNDEVQSARVIRQDGTIVAVAGPHATHWNANAEKSSTATRMVVPITADSTPWGSVQVQFHPVHSGSVATLLGSRTLGLFGFVGLASLLVYSLYLQRMLAHLDPSRVIPQRVRAALDTLAEGLVVLDQDERIVLANKAFQQTVGKEADELQGARVAELGWCEPETLHVDESVSVDLRPWTQAMRAGTPQVGAVLGLKTRHAEKRFRVNSTPIQGEDGTHRGVLTSFDDVTAMEKNREELQRMLKILGESRDEVSRQNVELHRLATQDPLTECLNRRSFFSEFDREFSAAAQEARPLACVMVDVDHFKSVNDRFGHDVGDDVLRTVSATLRELARGQDFVARYGGEEFCVLLTGTDVDQAEMCAERYRQAIEAIVFDRDDLIVTASLGVSGNAFGAKSPQELLKQADECLYAAKRSGRNRVIRWDTRPELPAEEVAEHRATQADSALAETESAIPYHAVAVLTSTLAYRDSATAAHSRRVADLCVTAGSGIMSMSDVYVLEMAALLHDIGKIGVPDAILLKPGPLTEEEWKVMSVHDQIGVDIIESTFTSPKLSEIIANHHAWYGKKKDGSDLPTGEDIPVGARLLSIADAFDAMVSDRVYRKGRPPQQAFEELRRCAGTQFDPRLVEIFVEAVSEANCSQRNSLPQVSKQTALQLGVEIERLADALDHRDMGNLATLASRLHATATTGGILPVADAAKSLQEMVGEDKELLDIVKSTTELLGLCRETQRAYLRDQTRPATAAVES